MATSKKKVPTRAGARKVRAGKARTTTSSAKSLKTARATDSRTKSSAKAQSLGPRTKAPVKPSASSGKGGDAKVSQNLTTYRSKRDFAKTPEPAGKTAARRSRQASFVIQKHAASSLHYDFRLEIDGTLKSWAVPKGPSMNPSDKRLAVETEDHPMAYADFEGTIPEDEYGGGTVIVWDTGPYRNLKQKAGAEVPMGKCYENGQVEVWLEGTKLRGGFALIHSRMGGNAKNWLLIKMKDEMASSKSNPVARQTRSVLTGRTIAQVAREPGNVWSSR